MRDDDGSAGSAARLCLASRRPLAASFAMLPVSVCPLMLAEDPSRCRLRRCTAHLRQQAPFVLCAGAQQLACHRTKPITTQGQLPTATGTMPVFADRRLVPCPSQSSSSLGLCVVMPPGAEIHARPTYLDPVLNPRRYSTMYTHHVAQVICIHFGARPP
jgi:hypothetical protein